MSKKNAANIVVAKVKAVQVGEIDELLLELVNKTTDVASDAGAGAILAMTRERDKYTALATLESLKARYIDERKLAEMDKTGRMKILIAQVGVLRKYEQAGHNEGGIFIPALSPNHPAMVKRAEIEETIAKGLKEANKVVTEAIRQQTEYCKQMGYIGGGPAANVRTTSK